jgi:hypothetical protein
MSSKWCLTAVLLVAVSSQGQEAKFDFRQASGDADVRSVFATFMKFSANRPDDLEHAAFMVRDADGKLSCVQWPYVNWEHARNYRGVVPEGTVAIIRVQSWGEERPSSADITQSVTSGLPVYTLTRWSIYAVDPASGETVQIVSSKDWSNGVTASKGGRCSQMKNWRPIAKTHRPVPVMKEPASAHREP